MDRANETQGAVSATPAPQATRDQRRRLFVRGAAAAVPTILTLHSGAALARTSNLISRAPGAPTDAAGNNLCLNERSAAEILDGGQRYDLGDPVQAEVTQIPSNDGRKFYVSQDMSGDPLTGQQMCEQGGTFYYESQASVSLDSSERADLIRQSFLPPTGAGTGEKSAAAVEVPRGGLVSATALASFAGRVLYRSI